MSRFIKKRQKEEKNIIFKTASEHAFTYSLAAIIYKKKPYLMKRYAVYPTYIRIHAAPSHLLIVFLVNAKRNNTIPLARSMIQSISDSERT